MPPDPRRRARIAQSTNTTLELRVFDETGALQDAAAAVTVSVTRGDGTIVVAPVPAGKPADTTGVYELALTPAHTSLVDELTATWMVPRAGGTETARTYHDVVSTHYFTLSDVRAYDPLQDTVRYPGWLLEQIRDGACGYLEQACGVAFARRYHREQLVGRGSHVLAAGHVRLRAVRSLTVDGTPVEGDDLAAVLLDRGGAIRREQAWPEFQRIDVAYEHGHDTPDPEVIRAAQLLTRRLAVSAAGQHAIDDRARGMVLEGGGSIDFITASAGVATEVPEVNALIARYRER